MASAKFYLQKKNADEYPIYLHFSFKYSESNKGKSVSKRLRYSTGLKINPKFWNSKKQRAKETSKFPEYPEFNTRLSNLASDIATIHSNLINNEIQPTPELLKKKLNQKYKKLTEPTKEVRHTDKLLSYIEYFINDSEQRQNERTVKKYRTTRNRIKEFLEKKGKTDIKFKDIDLEFYNHFKDYLTNEFDYSQNTVGKHIKTFKTFLNSSFDAGIHSNRIHKHKKFTAYDKPTPKIYLNDNDLEKLYKVDLSHNKTYDKVRDLFLIGCYTALRFSDFTTIIPENIVKGKNGNEFVKKNTQKTQKSVFIPIHYIVKQILTKYDYRLPKPISNQRMNKYIKEVGKLAGVNDSTIKYVHKKGNITKEEIRKKYELITTHTARRTAATNMYKAGIPAMDIMKITGHTRETTFLRYIQISSEEAGERLAEHNFFKPQMKIAR